MRQPELMSCVVSHLLLTFQALCHPACVSQIGELCGDSFAAHVVSFVPCCMHHAEMVSCAVIHLLLAL